ncbi:hypothetical protein AUJ84_01835 [Candidatus Pacearchaeota archaeon CG1_02_32_132]|nr:MAG: hypothetical protein AUJ84_01835 [Candidatus Pacearchaeota archaeon CG1_02_32_132]
MKILIVVVKLLFLGALFIISNNNIHLTDSGERDIFFNYYSGWINTMFNQGVELTGYLVKFEWLPTDYDIDLNS